MKGYWKDKREHVSTLMHFWESLPIKVQRNIHLTSTIEDMPVLENNKKHQVIIHKGIDLWDASRNKYEPRFEKPDATREEAIAWLGETT